MVEERGIETVEQAVADHDPLAGAALLGRCPEEHDLAGQLVRDRGQGDRRADPGRGHRVVAAAMAETGQGVVLGEDADPRSLPAQPAGEDGPDGRLEAAGGVLDDEAVAGDRLGHPAGGLALLEGRLGIGVDPVGQLEDLGPVRLDGRGDPPLGIGERLGRGGGEQIERLDGHGASYDHDPSVTARRTGSLRRPTR